MIKTPLKGHTYARALVCSADGSNRASARTSNTVATTIALDFPHLLTNSRTVPPTATSLNDDYTPRTATYHEHRFPT
jgi:hypothetical protein